MSQIYAHSMFRIQHVSFVCFVLLWASNNLCLRAAAEQHPLVPSSNELTTTTNVDSNYVNLIFNGLAELFNPWNLPSRCALKVPIFSSIMEHSFFCVDFNIALLVHRWIAERRIQIRSDRHNNRWIKRRDNVCEHDSDVDCGDVDTDSTVLTRPTTIHI